MAKFEWDSRLETGIRVIDGQHKELFKRIDQLELAIYKGESEDEFIRMMDFLNYYVNEHFDLEETVMKKNKYHDLPKHRLEHEDFRTMYKNLKNEFLKRGTDAYLAIDVDKKIRNWWEHHVMEIDMAYVPALKNKEWTIVRG